MPLLNGLAILLVAGSVAVWIAALNRLRSGSPILEAEPRTPVPWRALDLCFVLVVYLVAQLAFQDLTARWMQIGPEATPGELSPQKLSAILVANAVANLLVVMVSIIGLRLRCGPGVGDMGFRPWRPLADLTIGILAFAAVFAPVFAIQTLVTKLIPYEHPIQDLLRRVASGEMLLLCVVSAVIVAPLAEEFLFRVLFQGWMESVVLSRRREVAIEPPQPTVAAPDPVPGAPVASSNPDLSPTQASSPVETIGKGLRPPLMIAPIVFSSLAFGLVHFGNGPAPIPLFFLALVLGYLYQKTHRIWPSVVVHACLNGWSVALLWSQQP